MKPFDSVSRVSNMSFVPIEMVTERVYRDYKFITDIRVSDVMEWIGIIYGSFSVPHMFRMKVTGNDIISPNIVVSNHRGILPPDYRKSLPAGIRDYDTKEVYRESLGTFTRFKSSISGDTKSENLDKLYNITGGYIFTEDEDVTLEMSYEAFPIDDRGYPLVPDDEKVIEYAKEFIAEKITFNLFAAGKISKDIWDIIDRRRMFKSGAAHTSLIRPNPDTMESWTWARLRLIPRIQDFQESFAYFGSKEDLRLGTN
jgi:hypothetical protein